MYRWSTELEGIFVLPLAPRWVRHSYLSKTVAIPYTCGLLGRKFTVEAALRWLSFRVVWVDHSDVLLVSEVCTRPPCAILAVHARSEDVHARHARTQSLARTRGYMGGRNFVPGSTPCDNLTHVKSFTSLMVN